MNLDLVLKVAEVCNINCSYCYFFNGPDQSFRSHPAHMPASLAARVPEYINAAAAKGEIGSARIILHGGEPLMMGKRRFTAFCEALAAPSCAVPTCIVLQTNAILVDEEWLQIFQKFDISVGVSVDGPQNYHDEHRVDHRGRGTHAAVVKGIRLLTKAAAEGAIGPVGALCVVDPSRNARTVYRHIVDDLDIRSISFLLPDGDWSSVSEGHVQQVGHYLDDALAEWLADDNPTIQIRMFTDIVRFVLFQRDVPYLQSKGLVVGVSSDGSIAPDDIYRITLPHLFAPENARLNLSNSELTDYLHVYHHGYLAEVQTVVPLRCQACRWVTHCGGGDGAHRYSAVESFRRQSVYCAALERIYEKLETYLLNSGVSREYFEQAFHSRSAV